MHANKKWLLGAISMASSMMAIPQHAAAQNLVLYGAVDASVTSTNTDAPGASRISGVSSGVLTPSLWGFRGREDLGSGMAAIFQLESGFNSDTGSATTYSGNPSTATPTAPNGTPSTGFNRRSYVGLQGGFGTLALGRDYTPVYWALRDSDAFGLTLYGNLQSLVPVMGGSERWARASNGLFYTSPTFAGLTARAVYSLGSESPGGAGAIPKDANQLFGAGLQYVYSNLSLNATYQTLKIANTGGSPAAFTGSLTTRKDMMVGGRYKFSDFSVSAGYFKARTPVSASDAWIGGSANFGVSTVTAQVQRLKQTNLAGAERRGTVFGLGYVYNLSKRTALYASYGSASNNSTGTFSVASADTLVAAGAPGADPSAYAFGIRHSF